MGDRRYSLVLLGAFFAFMCVVLAWPVSPRMPQDRPVGSVVGEDIVVLGTSLSHGGWPRTLNQTLQGCDIQSGSLLQLTKPGANSGWGLTQLDKVVDAAPALVLIEFAINDADILDGLSLEVSRRNHQDILERLSQALPEAKLVFLTMSPTSGLKRLSRPFLGQFYAMVAEEAEAANIGLIDLYPRWETSLRDGVVLPDGLHPLPKDMARVALPPILHAIAAAFGARCAT